MRTRDATDGKSAAGPRGGGGARRWAGMGRPGPAFAGMGRSACSGCCFLAEGPPTTGRSRPSGGGGTARGAAGRGNPGAPAGATTGSPASSSSLGGGAARGGGGGAARPAKGLPMPSTVRLDASERRDGGGGGALLGGAGPAASPLRTTNVVPHLGQRILRPPGGTRRSSTRYGARHPSHSTFSMTPFGRRSRIG